MKADHGNAQAQLDQDRDRNNQKLKSRFEHIFRKYEHDFTGIGDEFDIHTDQIIVNNGHLEYMRNEADSGTTASSKFVKTFREKLAHEDESITSEDEEDEEDQDDGSTAGSDTELEEADASQIVSQHTPRLPQLFKLLAGEGTSQEPLEVPDDEESEDDSVSETTSRDQTPAVVDALRITKRSSSAEARARSKRPMADDDTVHALGMSIATQLAKLMGASSRKKPKKKATVMHGATDPVWDYPELKQTSKTKRKRSISPGPPPQLSSSPQTTSPEGRSLWAITGSTQHGKRRRRDDTSNAVELKVRKYGNPTESHDSKRCWNCSLTRSPSWRRGPHGQDLCLPCGQYYEHHGRMKGFDSATPPVDSQPQTSVPTSRNIEESETVTDTENSLVLEGDAEHIQYEKEMHHADKTPEHVPRVEDDERSTPSIPYQANTSRPIISSASKRKVPAKWTIEEDALLIKLKERDRLSWDTIALHFPNRTTFTIQKSYSARLKGANCPGRTLFNAQVDATAEDVESELEFETDVDDDDDHDLDWSPQQDDLLVALRDVDELDWTEIADLLPGHDPKAVERRYVLLTSSTRHESTSNRRSKSTERTNVSFHGDTVTAQPDQPALLIDGSRDHHARRSLPASMPTSSRRSGSGNALLRQALGNSHRRRSDMDGLSGPAPLTASHSTSHNIDSYGHARDHSTCHDDSAEVRRTLVLGIHEKRRRTSRGTSADAECDAREALINSFGDDSQQSPSTTNDDSLGLARPPDLSWRQIVDSAFTSTNSESMSNQDLFAWIEANYGYYSTAPRAWKNFVREELRVNDKYELDTARKRNSVWRVKEEPVDHAQDNDQYPADVSLETAAVDEIDTSGISDSGALETIDSTPSQQSSRSAARHVSFSPVVTVSTPVPVVKKRPRAKPQKQGLQPSPSAEKSSAVLEIPDSDPLDAPTCSPELGTEHSITAEASLDINRAHSSSSPPARESKSGKLKMPSFSASGNDATQSPSSPARAKRVSPASIFKTPKQASRSRLSDSAKRHSTPIINHKFMTSTLR